MNFRILQLEDYDKNFLDILRTLTDVGTWTKETFQVYVAHQIIKNPYLEVWVGYDEETEELICCGTILWEPKIIHGGKMVAHIEDIAVQPKFQKKGYGKQLILHLIEQAKTRPIYKIILDCSETNTCFYKKCGFTIKGHQMELRV